MISGYTPHFWETTIYVEIVPLNPMFKWLCRLGIYHGSPWYPPNHRYSQLGYPTWPSQGIFHPSDGGTRPLSAQRDQTWKKNECETFKRFFIKKKKSWNSGLCVSMFLVGPPVRCLFPLREGLNTSKFGPPVPACVPPSLLPNHQPEDRGSLSHA